MANSLDTQIVEEGWRNALVKITGVIDTENVSLTPAISPGDFSNNDSRAGSVSGFRVDLVEWSISQGLELVLEWNSLLPKQIVPIAGRGRIHAAAYGGMIPDTTRDGYDGTINLKSTGFDSGNVYNFSVMVELVKLYS